MSDNLPQQNMFLWAGVYDVVNLAGSGLTVEKSALNGIGAAPIIINRMDNGVDYMVEQLRQRVLQTGTIDLLRIHGHGGPGVQTISCSKDLRSMDMKKTRSILSYYNFEHIRPCLEKMKGYFAPNAQVWLMGCEVGAKFEGKWLIAKLAQLWRVQVTAGIPIQKGGGLDTFQFEGQTATAYP